MKIDDYIDAFVEKEKQTEFNPFLTTNIMAHIEKSVRKKTIVWQILTVAAGIALVITMGIQIGNQYDTDKNMYAGVNINDSQIENFTLYYSNENE